MDGKPETVIDTFIQVAGGVLWHATGDDVSVEAPTVSAWNGAVGQGLGTSLPALMAALPDCLPATKALVAGRWFTTVSCRTSLLGTTKGA